MIKDGKFVCSDFPQYNIEWGQLRVEDAIKIREWLDDNVTNLCSNVMIEIKDTNKCRDFIESFVDEVYHNIYHVGYEEGYNSAECDNEGEGL